MKNHNYKLLSALLALSMLASPASAAFASSKDSSEGRGYKEDSLKGPDGEIDYSKIPEEEKIRVVVELKGEPILEKAKKAGKEVKDLSSFEVEREKKALEAEQEKVKEKMSKENIESSSTKDDEDQSADASYTNLMNGFSTYLKAGDIDKLKRIKNVKNVYPVNEFYRAPDVPMMESSNKMIGSPLAWESGYKGEGMVVAVIDSGYDMDHKDFKITDPSKVKLTREKVEEIIKDKNLPGRYYSEKFPYAYNYYDRTHNIKSSTSNHGQHVAGTIAANGNPNEGGIRGVAPEAQLLGMKVFSDDPLYATTFSDIYAKAIDDSIALGADAINMSLGSTAGSYVYGGIEEVYIKKAKEAGILVSIAAGNEHSSMVGAQNFLDQIARGIPLAYRRNDDAGVLGSPSLYDESLSVASANNMVIKAYGFNYDLGAEKKSGEISYASGAPLPWEVGLSSISGADIAYINAENKGEGSDAPGDKASIDNHNLKGKVALIERGNTFTDTIVNAQEAGAKAVIIYNNERPDAESLINMAGGDLAEVPFAIITRSAGLDIINNLDKVTVNFPEELLDFKAKDGGEISAFSSWGTTPNLQIKPEITAPGGNIYSTDNDNGYVNMSGTSMATPHMAGASALVYQRIKNLPELFGKLDGTELSSMAKTLMMNTARPMTNPSGNLYLVRQQGAGMLDLEGALSAESYVLNEADKSPKVELGSFKGDKLTMDFRIYNLSDKVKSYDISGSALTDAVVSTDDGQDYLVEESAPLKEAKFESKGRIIVPKKSSRKVTVTLDLSRSIDFSELKDSSFVEGFVSFKEKSGQEDLSLPFLAYYGDFEAGHVLDEPLANLFDQDLSNDPMFTNTSLVNYKGGRYSQAMSFNPTYVKTEGLKDDEAIGFMSTVLRNYDHIDFTIEDRAGRVLKNLGREDDGRKVFNMDQGRKPSTLFEKSLWDGTIDNKALAPGESVYYTVKAYFKKNSKPQVLRFELQADSDKPKMENLSYDEGKNSISLGAKDMTSGIDSIFIVDFASLSSAKPIFKAISGEKNLEKVRLDGDKHDGSYEIGLDEAFDKSEFIAVEVSDKAGNTDLNFINKAAKAEEAKEESKKDPEDLSSMAPMVEGEAIFKDEEIKGQAFRPEADIILEREKEENREEVARTKSDDKGAFNFGKVGGLEDGETVYLYSIKDGKKSDESTYEVGHDPNIMAFGDLNIILETPDLLQGYNTNEIVFKGTVYGWENIDEIVFGEGKDYEKSIDFRVNDRQEVKNPQTGDKLYYGKAYNFKTTINLKDGFYSDPIIVKDKKNNREKGISRRFWVDTKAPDLDIKTTDNIAVINSNNGKDITILTPSDNVKVRLDFSDNNPITGVSRDGKAIKSENVSSYSGYMEFKSAGSINDIITLSEGTKEISTSYEVKDLANNSTSINVRVVRTNDLVKTPEDNENPRIIAYDRYVFKNERLDLLDGIKAFDKNGEDISHRLRSNPESIDTSKTDTYEVTYFVSDEDQNSSQKKVKVEVLDRENEIVSFDELIGLINKAKAFDKEDLTKKSYKDLEDAIGEAEYLLKIGSKGLNQGRVDGSSEKLRKAIDGIVKIDRLKNSLAYGKDILAYAADLFSEDCLAILDEAIKDAEEIIREGRANQDMVDRAKDAIEAAIEGLEGKEEASEPLNKDNLASLIADIEEKLGSADLGAYTEDSLNKLKEEVSKAKDLLADENASQEAIDQAENSVLAALKSLVREEKPEEKSADKAALEDAYKTLIGLDLSAYTDESRKALEEKLEAAKAVLEDESVSQEEVDKALDELLRANDRLVIKEEEKADKENLHKAYEELVEAINEGAIDKDAYTEDSYKDLYEAIEAAKLVLENESASQADIDKALADLLKAKSSLVIEEKADKDMLVYVYNILINKDLGAYEESSVGEFKKALAEAKAVIEDENISQEEVDRALDKILVANDRLRAKESQKEDLPGKKVLELRIKNAEEVDTSDLTDESKDALDKAISKAKDSLNEAKSEDEIKSALDDLNKAIENLSKKEVLNKENLEAIIKEAKEAKDKDLGALIKEAEAILKASKDQSEIDKAYLDLRKILDEGYRENSLSDLKDLVNEGSKALSGTKISKDGSDIGKDESWTSKKARDDFELKLEEAKKTLEKEDLSPSDLKKQAEDLEKSLEDFKKPAKPGSKDPEPIKEPENKNPDSKDDKKEGQILDEEKTQDEKESENKPASKSDLEGKEPAENKEDPQSQDKIDPKDDSAKKPSKEEVSEQISKLKTDKVPGNKKEKKTFGKKAETTKKGPIGFIKSIFGLDENTKEISKKLSQAEAEALKEAIFKNKVATKSAAYLLKNTPATVAPVKDKLEELIKKSEKLVKDGEKALKKNGIDPSFRIIEDESIDKAKLKKLNEAAFSNKIMVEAARLLIKNTPNTIKDVRSDLEALIEKSENLLK